MSGGGSSVRKPSAPPLKSVFKKPQPVNPNSLPFFSRIVEDIIVNIFSRLEEDPRHLARLACVCRRFDNVIKSLCYKRQCMKVVPTIVSELMQSHNQQELLGEPPGGWGALQKLLVCCPGLRHTGVLLNCWDYGLERAIGCSDDFELVDRDKVPKFSLDLKKEKAAAGKNLLALIGEHGDMGTSFENQSDSNKTETVKRTESLEVPEENQESQNPVVEKGKQSCCKKKFGEEAAVAGLDTKLESGGYSEQKLSPNALVTFSIREAPGLRTNGAKFILKRKKWEGNGGEGLVKQMKKGGLHYHSKVMKDSRFHGSYRRLDCEEVFHDTRSSRSSERRRSRDRNGEESGSRGNNENECGNHEEEPHLAKGIWILTREQGHKLLASRFRSDCLYICDWPGCMHQGEKRVYKLFRGLFKNFEHSHVFRSLKDLRAKKSEIRCAFCSEGTYDMVTSFCLRHSLEYHEDGEPVVRAYVCENGHVAGAWTDRPLYNF